MPAPLAIRGVGAHTDRGVAEAKRSDSGPLYGGDFGVPAAELDLLPRIGQAAETLEQVSSERRLVIPVELEAEALGHQPQRCSAVDEGRLVFAGDQLGLIGVELVLDLSDDLLEHVLERNERLEAGLQRPSAGRADEAGVLA